jgi:uncharacterized protein (TIGR02145 family)
MKTILFLITIFFALTANAQNYLITFAGAGASSSVNNVKVENLTSGKSLTLNGNDILHLTGTTTGINPVENEQSSGMKIYPNPMIDNSTVEIFPPVAGDANITVYDITGKLVTHIHSYLENNRQEFKLSGTKNGFYLINVTGNNYQFSGKLLCNGKSNGTISIEKISNNIQKNDEEISKMDYKGVQATVDMPYSTGDRLKLTGISDIYITIIIDIPTTSKVVTFTFIACTDGDGNNYPVIQIGTGKCAPQNWMAENLKTTKFKDGKTSILNVTDYAAWTALSTPAYCWYNNDAAYKATYGALYNWYTVSTGNLCPTGWHVPTDAEWTTLTNYFLGGESVAGGKLKETGTTHWANPNTGATNETGFTALPGGYRSPDGAFCCIGSYGKWWSALGSDASEAWVRYLSNSFSGVSRSLFNKNYGLSVRCLKD